MVTNSQLGHLWNLNIRYSMARMRRDLHKRIKNLLEDIFDEQTFPGSPPAKIKVDDCVARVKQVKESFVDWETAKRQLLKRVK
jgi:hypothetical protein